VQNNDNTHEADSLVADPGSRSEKARGSFDIRTKRGGQRPVKIYLMIVGLVLAMILGFGGIWYYAIGEITAGSKDVDESKAKADTTLEAKTASDDSMKKYKEDKLREMEEDRLKQEREAAKKKQEEASKPPPEKPAGNVKGGTKDSPQLPTAAQRKLTGGVMLKADLNDVSAYEGASKGAPDAAGQPGSDRPAGGSGDSDVPLASLDGGRGSSSRGSLNNLSGPDFTASRASLAPNGKYLLAHGTYGRCALYTEIITEQPGIVDCRLTEPLYSVDGSTVIAEAGARMSGVQTVEMKAGQVNVFTAWTELETTKGVRAKLDSLGAGPMGSSGTQAWIDNHYKERFGGALVLSLFKDVMTAVVNKSQSSSGQGGYTINNSEQSVEGIAEKTLDSTINIAQTGHVLPGTVITVIVARDIDFSSVYENR
jgi:type IV secretion system protein VirB10